MLQSRLKNSYIEENLIKDKFAIVVPNYLWCSDITEPVCKDSKIFTCGILDVATRRLVGWAIERHQRQEIVRTALEMAVGRNPQRPEGALCTTATEDANTPQKSQRIG